MYDVKTRIHCACNAICAYTWTTQPFLIYGIPAPLPYPLMNTNERKKLLNLFAAIKRLAVLRARHLHASNGASYIC